MGCPHTRGHIDTKAARTQPEGVDVQIPKYPKPMKNKLQELLVRRKKAKRRFWCPKNDKK